MTRNRNRGFTIAEFVVAIVFLGVVLGPLLVFVARIQDLNSAVGQQARREAWRTFADQAVTAGIDPSRALGLQPATNAAIPNVTPPSVKEAPVAPVAGLARIVPLQTLLETTAAEPRLIGGGFQIGAGAVVDPPGTPAAPLAPIVMPRPSVSPADGTIVAASSLTPAAPNAPYTLGIDTTGSVGARVHTTLDHPVTAVDGIGSNQITVTATDLLNGVNGRAWAEFDGDASAGHKAVTLPDGRVRWLITTPEHRTQIYEPSPVVGFAYQLGLGAPVLAFDSIENAAGATVGFDYTAYQRVQTGASTVRLTFPASIKAAFGNAWPASAIGFDWTFHGVAGPFSGEAASFFQPALLSSWADTVTIAATPVVPKAAVANAALWFVSRSKLVLGEPVLSSGPDAGGFFAPGTVQFAAPARPDGSTIGRLSFGNGADLSTGPTLALPVFP